MTYEALTQKLGMAPVIIWKNGKLSPTTHVGAVLVFDTDTCQTPAMPSIWSASATYCNVCLTIILVNIYLEKLFAPNQLITAVCR